MKKVIFTIASVSAITNGFVVLCHIDDSNREFYGSPEKINAEGQAPFVFTGQRAQIMLRSMGLVGVTKLKNLVKLGKATLTFEAVEGKAGEMFKDQKGNERTYKQDGWNLLGSTITLSNTAQNILDSFIERVEEKVAVAVATGEYLGMNGAVAQAGIAVPEEAPAI